jgi:DNA-binding NarL/FixJ family response regulator
MCIRVLIVADTPAWQQRLAGWVRACGRLRLVGAAGNSRQAQAMLDLHPVDVAVVDLPLLADQGLALLRHIACCRPRCQALVVSERAQDAQLWDAIEAGAAGHLLRHVLATSLGPAIQDVAAGGAPMSPAIARRVRDRLRDTLRVGLAQGLAEGAEHAPLTLRESEVLTLLARGLSFEAMGGALFVSQHTVVAHVKHIYRKLDVHSRAQAVFKARQARLL